MHQIAIPLPLHAYWWCPAFLPDVARLAAVATYFHVPTTRTFRHKSS
jgi:hypothetical protein